MGIGASGPGANTANVCTGLDVFKDLLGRLNGQSEATIEKKRQVRENVKLTLYVERRWGPMRFVRGGFLVGDDETNEAADDTETSEEPEKLKVDSTPSSRGIKTTPGVEADEINPEAAPSRADKKDKKARKEEKKRSKKRKPPSDEDDHDEKEASADDTHREKKRRRREEKDEGKKEKKEKRETKEKKEKKRDKKEKKRRRDETTSEEETTESLPTPPNAASPVPARTGVSGRHLARRRYITQKRAAVADPQALKQVSILFLLRKGTLWSIHFFLTVVSRFS